MPFETGYDENAVLEQYEKWNILNMEMEAETIFTLASLNNVLSGSICAVHCNRITDQWLVDFEPAQSEMCIRDRPRKRCAERLLPREKSFIRNICTESNGL